MKKIIYPVVAFAIIFFASIYGKLTLAADADTPTGWDPDALSVFNLPEGSISEIISNALFWLLTIFGFLAIIGFVVSGVMYIISSGNEDTMKKAKNAMIYSIIGVLVALSGLVIVYAVNTFLGGTDSEF
jgi:hypothetical protein